MSKKLLFLAVLSLAVFLVGLPASAKTVSVSKPGELSAALSSLVSGDVLSFGAGDYRAASLVLDNLHGSAGAPITIKADGRAIVRGTSASAPVLEIKNSSYLVVDGFEIISDAKNNQADGVVVSGANSSDITLKNLHIHDVGGDGLEVAAGKMKNFILTDSEIDNTGGSAVLLGGTGREISDSAITNNYLHHAPKNSNEAGGYGIRLGGGAYRVVVSGNVLHDAGGRERAAIFSFYGKNFFAGDSQADANEISGNIIWSARNKGIAVSADALVEDNVIFKTKYGLDIDAYSDSSFASQNCLENLAVRNNTVFSCGAACLTLNSLSAAGAQVYLANNSFYQNTSDKVAVNGSLGNADASGNTYCGISTLSRGAIKMDDSAVFARALSSVKEPKIKMNDSLRAALSAAVAGVTSDSQSYIRPAIINMDEVASLEMDKVTKKEDFVDIKALVAKTSAEVLAQAMDSVLTEEEKRDVAGAVNKIMEEQPGQSREMADKVLEAAPAEAVNQALAESMSKVDKNILDKIVAASAKEKISITNSDKVEMARFIKDGTETTKYLGAGERGGVIDSFRAAFGKTPQTDNDWKDLIKIANGRWPTQKSPAAESEAKTLFAKVYRRAPDPKRSADNAALNIVSYGLRSVNRNLDSEKCAIKSFKAIFGRTPGSARDWDAVRAIAYSGAKR